MHDVKNVRSSLFEKDRSKPYSVNQRARIVCMNQGFRGHNTVFAGMLLRPPGVFPWSGLGRPAW